MENEHVLGGLIRKRAEIAGQLDAVQSQVRQLITDIDAVDVTIRLFDPDIDLVDVCVRHVPVRHPALQGETGRLILTCLRETGGPLTTKDVTLRIMSSRGLNIADIRLTRTVQERVGTSLRYLREKGIVQSDRGKGSNLRWWLTG